MDMLTTSVGLPMYDTTVDRACIAVTSIHSPSGSTHAAGCCTYYWGNKKIREMTSDQGEHLPALAQ